MAILQIKFKKLITLLAIVAFIPEYALAEAPSAKNPTPPPALGISEKDLPLADIPMPDFKEFEENHSIPPQATATTNSVPGMGMQPPVDMDIPSLEPTPPTGSDIANPAIPPNQPLPDSPPATIPATPALAAPVAASDITPPTEGGAAIPAEEVPAVSETNNLPPPNDLIEAKKTLYTELKKHLSNFIASAPKSDVAENKAASETNNVQTANSNAPATENQPAVKENLAELPIPTDTKQEAAIPAETTPPAAPPLPATTAKADEAKPEVTAAPEATKETPKATEVALTAEQKSKLEEAFKASQVGQTAAAIILYKEVLAQDPNNKNALFGLATSYHKNNQIDQARAIYVQILTKHPDNKESLNNFLVLTTTESPANALVELEKLEKSNKNSSALQAQLGMTNMKLGNHESAIKYFNSAIALEPGNINYKFNLAILYDKLGKDSLATQLYHQIVGFVNNGGKFTGSIENVRKRMMYLDNKIQKTKP